MLPFEFSKLVQILNVLSRMPYSLPGEKKTSPVYILLNDLPFLLAASVSFEPWWSPYFTVTDHAWGMILMKYDRLCLFQLESASHFSSLHYCWLLVQKVL